MQAGLEPETEVARLLQSPALVQVVQDWAEAEQLEAVQVANRAYDAPTFALPNTLNAGL